MIDDPQALPRIEDLSAISAENFKQRNRDFLIGNSPYEILGGYTMREAQHEISVVRNGDLRRVLKDFPRQEPLNVQCANWMHAVVGKHYFPDANHRTAMALLRELLRENGVYPGNWDPEQTRLMSIRSHRVRKEVGPIRLDTLYQKDRLFLVWLLYFNDVLRDLKKVER